MRIIIHPFVHADVETWPQSPDMWTSSFADALEALVAAAFGPEPPPDPARPDPPFRGLDGRLEYCGTRYGGAGVLKAWADVGGYAKSKTVEVVGAAYGSSEYGFDPGARDVSPGPTPVLCAAAAGGGRRWLRRSWIGRDLDGQPRRREAFTSGGRGGFAVCGGVWLQTGERYRRAELINLFEPVVPGARHASDAPAGLAFQSASPLTWRWVRGGRGEIKRPVVVRLTRSVRLRFPRAGELTWIHDADDFVRERYRE